MFQSYFKIAFRNIMKNRTNSIINIAGLSVGLAVAILVGLWIWDELAFNKYHENYSRIAQIMQHQTLNEEVVTQKEVPIPLGNELRASYANEFEYVVESSPITNHVLSIGDHKFAKTGSYMQAKAPAMLTLQMVSGDRQSLADPSSVLLSESIAATLFGKYDPTGKVIRIDDQSDVKVAGVYKDLPYNSDFKDLGFIANWELLLSSSQRMQHAKEQWGNNPIQIYVQVNKGANMGRISTKIRDVKLRRAGQSEARFNPRIFLQPMERWHLYSEWENGVNVGGRIQYVWLFGAIGVIVVLLACINFMNMSTARSEKRAKEVGIRKSIGSLRSQLIIQFFAESLLMVLIAYVLAMVMALLMLPFFNAVADKKMSILWDNPWFWTLSFCIIIITGLIAGSYPSLYLSSFRPVKVLKGTFRVGRLAAIPRKVLVVFQFSMSVMLAIGTIIVFRQIQFVKDRPIGFNTNGLLTTELLTTDLFNNYTSFRNDLLGTGAIVDVAKSSSPTTEVRNEQSGFDWKGRDPNGTQNFATIGLTHEFGKTVGWQFVKGRDFSKEFASDSMGFVINEAAARFMGFKEPVGELIQWIGHSFTVLGVIKDMVMQSPYEPVKPTIFYISPWAVKVVSIKLNPHSNARQAINKIEPVFKKYAPAEPFNFKFVDEEYDAKFRREERIGKLASFAAILAIFISCLGLFGLASFIAELRTREIGVRKVLGASVFNVWRLLSKDFLVLVAISLLISIPIAYYFMYNWLQNYHVRTKMPWWIFVAAGAGVLFITMFTVSFHTLKAAMANPSKSLRAD